jgi:ABC-type glycerol-3-phosphate transport system permease component
MAAQHSVARVGPRAVAARPSWLTQSRRILGHDWPIGWLFFLPTALLLFGLIGYPFVRALYLSFFNVVGVREGAFVGLQNYANLWADDLFRRSILTTIDFTFFSEVFKFSLGVAIALLLHNLPRWASVLGGLVLLPYIIPEIVRALAWRILLDPIFGALNYILVDVLHVLSKGPSYLADPNTALPSVIAVNIWSGIPFFVILFLAGLKAIDHELYDAAAVDGANAWRRFLHVTLPGLRYVIIVATLLSTIFTFNSFNLTYLLTGGGPGGATRVYAILAYEYAIQAQRTSAGIAVAMIISPFLLVLILFLGRYMMRREDIAHASNEDGPFFRAIMTLLWPVRMLLRGLVAAFWAVDNLAETIAGSAARAMRSSNDQPRVASTTRKRIGYVLMYVAMAVVLVWVLLPFYFIFVTSFKTTLQITQIQNMFWPTPFSLEHFIFLFTQLPFPRWYLNTIEVAAVSTLISMFAASLGAYALVRLRWRGSNPLSTSVLVAYLMPPALMFIPLYAILVQLHLINTDGALMVTYPTVVLPFATWLMMGYYRSIPEELEDAAMIDGCNRFQTYYMVVLPLVRPALLAVAMFSVTQSWNEFLYAKTFLRSTEVFTLPVGLGQLSVADVQPWGELMAGALLTAVPVIILYMVGQKFMIAGLTAGSVKG